MAINKKNIVPVLCFFFFHFGIAQKTDLVKYVNTLRGTNSSFEPSAGNTYPTTALPFCMNAWSPQTGKNGDILHFEMGNQPNNTRGLDNEDKPFSLSKKTE
jgi:putative alpha-1,2-mannosidase